MHTIIEGHLSAEGVRIGIVISRFNSFITEKLLEGALDHLRRSGGAGDAVTIVRVPGSFEIPLAARALAASRSCDAVICLGTVIRGDTSHYDLVAQEAAKGIAQASLETGVPIVFGVVTAETLEQAIQRAGAKMGNKGAEAAAAAVEMAHVMKELGKQRKGK